MPSNQQMRRGLNEMQKFTIIYKIILKIKQIYLSFLDASLTKNKEVLVGACKHWDQIKILKHAFCYNYYKHHKMMWEMKIVSSQWLLKEEKENLDLIKAQFHLATIKNLLKRVFSSSHKGWRKKKKYQRTNNQKRGEKKIFLSFTRQCSFFNPQNNPISSLCLYIEQREKYRKKNYKRKKIVWYHCEAFKKQLKLCGV